MYRGSTPTLTFALPFATEIIDNAYISFAQYGAVKIEKQLDECVCSENNLSVTLSQAETLRLKSGSAVEIQISVRIENKVMRSQIISTSVERILKDGEIP